MYEYINGTVEVCVNGQYVPICGHSYYGIEANMTDDIGISVCYSIGYFGEFINNVSLIYPGLTQLTQIRHRHSQLEVILLFTPQLVGFTPAGVSYDCFGSCVCVL